MVLVYSYINNKLTLITLITIIYELVILICWLRSGDFKFITLYYFPSPSHLVFLSNICCLSDTCLQSNTLLMYTMHLLIISTEWSHVTQNMHNKIVKNSIKGDYSLSPSPPLLSSHTRPLFVRSFCLLMLYCE